MNGIINYKWDVYVSSILSSIYNLKWPNIGFPSEWVYNHGIFVRLNDNSPSDGRGHMESQTRLGLQDMCCAKKKERRKIYELGRWFSGFGCHQQGCSSSSMVMFVVGLLNSLDQRLGYWIGHRSDMTPSEVIPIGLLTGREIGWYRIDVATRWKWYGFLWVLPASQLSVPMPKDHDHSRYTEPRVAWWKKTTTVDRLSLKVWQVDKLRCPTIAPWTLGCCIREKVSSQQLPHGVTGTLRNLWDENLR